MGKTNEERPVLVGKILDIREQLLKDHDLKCLVVTALEKDSDQPIVVYHGDQLEYTALAVTVAEVLRQRVIDRVGGNVHIQKSQQALDTNSGPEQGSDQDRSGRDESSS